MKIMYVEIMCISNNAEVLLVGICFLPFRHVGDFRIFYWLDTVYLQDKDPYLLKYCVMNHETTHSSTYVVVSMA